MAFKQLARLSIRESGVVNVNRDVIGFIASYLHVPHTACSPVNIYKNNLFSQMNFAAQRQMEIEHYIGFLATRAKIKGKTTKHYCSQMCMKIV